MSVASRRAAAATVCGAHCQCHSAIATTTTTAAAAAEQSITLRCLLCVCAMLCANSPTFGFSQNFFSSSFPVGDALLDLWSLIFLMSH